MLMTRKVVFTCLCFFIFIFSPKASQIVPVEISAGLVCCYVLFSPLNDVVVFCSSWKHKSLETSRKCIDKHQRKHGKCKKHVFFQLCLCLGVKKKERAKKHGKQKTDFLRFESMLSNFPLSNQEKIEMVKKINNSFSNLNFQIDKLIEKASITQPQYFFVQLMHQYLFLPY